MTDCSQTARAAPLWRARRAVRRRGAALMAALVCTLIAMMLAGSLLRAVVREQRLAQAQRRQTQARWLAAAGIDRAAAVLRATPDYRGETWRVAPAELAGDSGGTVEIRVEPIADQPRQRRVSIEADYPDHPVHRVRCRQVAVVDLSRPGESP